MAIEEPPTHVSIWDWKWREWIVNFYRYVKANMGTDFFFEVSQGNVTGYSSNVKFGRINGTTGAGTDDVVAPFAPTYLTTASTIQIAAGGNVADDTAGAGA